MGELRTVSLLHVSYYLTSPESLPFIGYLLRIEYCAEHFKPHLEVFIILPKRRQRVRVGGDFGSLRYALLFLIKCHSLPRSRGEWGNVRPGGNKSPVLWQCDRGTPELSVLCQLTLQQILCQFILPLLLCNESNPNEVPRPAGNICEYLIQINHYVGFSK